MAGSENEVPVWTLTTKNADAPELGEATSLSASRLSDLRNVLATLVDAPVVTLEAHALPGSVDTSSGTGLAATSPLAKQISQLVGSTSDAGAGTIIQLAGETLFRLVLPSKVAQQLRGGLGLTDSKSGDTKSLLGKTTGGMPASAFVPVAAKIAGGGIGVMTVAAPLIFMAVAAGLNALDERDRHRTDRVLMEFSEAAVKIERAKLNACISSIDNAANVLLDEGKVGESLGLGTAAFEINVGLATTEARIQGWERQLEAFGSNRAEIPHLKRAFNGIGDDLGEFYAHLEFAKLSFELSRRLAVLQAVEHAQMDPENPFESFAKALARNSLRIQSLQDRASTVLTKLSRMEVDRSHGVRDFVFNSGEVDAILRTSRLMRSLESKVEIGQPPVDVAIEIVRKGDGSLVVMPATAT